MPEGLEFFTAPAGLAPGPGYSHAAAGRGRLVATAGQVALDAEGQMVGPGDPVAQADQVFQNLTLALAAAGATFEHVVKLTYFMLDVAALPAVREVRNRYVNTANPPASTAVQVSSLFRPGFLIEVEALAIVPD
jgi:enamine deaminase RidA (YjgF/YER057c/UK114 family)